MTPKMDNVTVVDMLLKGSECQDGTIDINKFEMSGFTAVYYAILASR